MNYRHAFHAGNFADCVKHALLVWMIQALARKPAPFFVLDTHAGAGAYDLSGDAARRTRESDHGIGKLLTDPPAALAPFVSLIRSHMDRTGEYPGSPALIAAMLRPDDRMACCELHPDDAAALSRRFSRVPAVAVHRRDAWEAVRGLLPPAQKRGLVLIDPPFEEAGEFDRLAEGLILANKRFKAGILVGWYPIKHLSQVRAFRDRLRDSGMRDIVAAEFCLREPTNPALLNGCGLAVVNPPFRFEEEAQEILRALLGAIGTNEAGAAATVTRIADE